MNDQVTEVAKATQEVAKAARTGIETVQGLGSFLAKVMGEPVETAVGMLTDRLKMARAERLLRLRERYEKALKERGITTRTQPVPPKIALPAIENASIENTDELQDLWANLLASAHDPKFKDILRSAFIDILRQLEVVDVHLLNYVYNETTKINLKMDTKHPRSYRTAHPIKYGIQSYAIQSALRVSEHAYECSVDNLMRVRCLTPYVEEIDLPGDRLRESATYVHEYDEVAITSLGWDFVRSCTQPVLGSSKVKRAARPA